MPQKLAIPVSCRPLFLVFAWLIIIFIIVGEEKAKVFVLIVLLTILQVL